MSEEKLKSILWDNLMSFLARNDVRLSEKSVDKIVGGKKHRERLVVSGSLKDIRKSDKAANSPWQYSAQEVFAHVRTYNK